MNSEVSIEEYVTFLFPYFVMFLTASLKSFPSNMNTVNGTCNFFFFRSTLVVISYIYQNALLACRNPARVSQVCRNTLKKSVYNDV
jgi:hypothetical protein